MDEKVARVQASMKSVVQACKDVGISTSTYYRRRARHDTLLDFFIKRLKTKQDKTADTRDHACQQVIDMVYEVFGIILVRDDDTPSSSPGLSPICSEDEEEFVRASKRP